MAGIVRIVVLDQPRANGDIVAMKLQGLRNGRSGIVVVEEEMVDTQQPMVCNPLFNKRIFILQDGNQANPLGRAAPVLPLRALSIPGDKSGIESATLVQILPLPPRV